jgi:hypothetical protein
VERIEINNVMVLVNVSIAGKQREIVSLGHQIAAERTKENYDD